MDASPVRGDSSLANDPINSSVEGNRLGGYRLHKPGVAGSSPAAATLTSVLFDEPNGQYHADRAHISTSSLKDFIRSPSNYHASLGKPSADSEAMARGRLAHLVLELGPDAFGERAKVIPAEHLTATGLVSTKADTKKWIADQGPDAILLSPSDDAFIEAFLAQFFLNKATSELYEDIKHRETSIRWQRADGAKLRCRPDAITHGGVCLDYKTTKFLNPLREFWMACRDFDYGLQAAFYGEGLAVAGLSDQPLVFILISTVGDCTVQAVTLPQRFIELGKRKMDRALADFYARSTFSNWEPEGYHQINELWMPEYLFKEGAE